MLEAKRLELERLNDPRANDIVQLGRENLDVITDYLPDLGDSSSVRRWVGECRHKHYRKVSIDPLFNALGSVADDLKNSAKVYPKLDYVTKHCEEAGIQLQVAHHDVIDRPQAVKYDWPTSRKLAYPVLRQAARQSISVGPGAEYDETGRVSVLHMVIVGKGNVSGGSFVVTITESRQYNRWQAIVTPRSEAIEQVRSETDRAAAQAELQLRGEILQMLRQLHDRGITEASPTMISEQIPGVSDNMVKRILLAAAGRGVGYRTVRHGNSYRYFFRLTSSHPREAGGSGGGGGSEGVPPSPPMEEAADPYRI